MSEIAAKGLVAPPLAIFLDDATGLADSVDYYFRLREEARFEVACFSETDAAIEYAVRNSGRILPLYKTPSAGPDRRFRIGRRWSRPHGFPWITAA
jgi:hypothetical protein